MVKDTRPVNLDLTSMTFPPMAIASILHRLSGIVLFILFPYILYLLNMSLKDEISFNGMVSLFEKTGIKFILWVFCSAWMYHAIAGVRHLIMDLGFGESLEAGRRSSILVIVLSILFIIFLGMRIW